MGLARWAIMAQPRAHRSRGTQMLGIIGQRMSSRTSAPLRHLAARSDGIPEGGRLVVDIGDNTVGIFRVRGQLFAYENTCPHMGGPVCQGLIIPAVQSEEHTSELQSQSNL